MTRIKSFDTLTLILTLSFFRKKNHEKLCCLQIRVVCGHSTHAAGTSLKTMHQNCVADQPLRHVIYNAKSLGWGRTPERNNSFETLALIEMFQAINFAIITIVSSEIYSTRYRKTPPSTSISLHNPLCTSILCAIV